MMLWKQEKSPKKIRLSTILYAAPMSLMSDELPAPLKFLSLKAKMRITEFSRVLDFFFILW